MLYKNGERYEMTDKETQELTKKYLNDVGILEVTWHPSAGTENPTKTLSPQGKYMTREQLMEFPASFSIPMTSTIVNSKGNKDVWNYADNTAFDPRTGQTEYLPGYVVMKTDLKVEDIELAFFLVNCCPFLANGKMGEELAKKGSYSPVLKILVAEQDAKEQLENEEIQDTARSFIRKDGAIADIRNIAASYGIPNSEDENEAIVRKTLLDIVKYDPQNLDPFFRFKEFLERVKGMSKSDEISAVVQRLLDAKAIVYDSDANTWFEVKTGGGNGSKILSLKANQSANAVGNLKSAAENQSKIAKQLKDLALTVAESKN